MNKFTDEEVLKNLPPFISRAQIRDYFPFLNPRTLANKQCAGNGPPFIKNGSRVIYRTRELLAWLDRQDRHRQGGEVC